MNSSVKKNVIPRNVYKIVCEQLRPTNGGRAGDVWEVYKASDIYRALNTRTGEWWRMFPAHLRISEMYRFITVETY